MCACLSCLYVRMYMRIMYVSVFTSGCILCMLTRAAAKLSDPYRQATSLCVCVWVSTILMINISETKRFRSFRGFRVQ